ncbi:MAG: prolipoprotein diacylglyceryl transferase family protein [Acidobacteriaceae bacterium]
MYPRLVQFGHVAIPTYGAFIALALIAALAAVVYFARRLTLDTGKLWNLGLIAIFTALIGARLLLAAVYFGAFREHPFWVLGLGTSHHSWINAVAVLLGVTAGLLYVMAEGLPHLRVLDCVAASATVGLVLSSTGAFLAGVGYGLPAGNGWSVTYRSPFAAYWYGTPLGFQLYPVQLYQAVVFLAILALLLWWLPRRRQDGELVGAWLFLAGFTGFFLDLYRASGRIDFVFHQVICALMVIASAAFLVRRGSGARTDCLAAHDYTVVDDSQHI